MPASTQIKPAGSYNNIGTDYVSPKEVGGDIDVLTAAAGTSFFTFDCNNASIEVDTIEEFTAGSGVTIDGVLLKDSWISPPAMGYFLGVQLGSSIANSAEFDIFKLDATYYPSQNLAAGTVVKNITYTEANGRFTFAKTGLYVITVSVRVSSTAGAWLHFNQNDVIFASFYHPGGSNVSYVTPPYPRNFTAGQYLNVTLAPTAGTIQVTNGYNTMITIIRVA